MNVIVTSNNIEYNGFVKVSSLSDVGTIVGSIDFLVFHKSTETREEKVEYLTKLKNSVKTIIYIRDREYMEQAVQMIVIGSDGKYIDDEFFLESSEELNRLIINLNEVTEMVQMGGVPVLSDFFNRYLKEGKSGFNAGYLSVVKKAVETMLADYHKKDIELLKMSTTATEIFSNSTEIIHRVRSESQKLRDAVDKIESTKDSINSTNIYSASGMQSIVFFPKVSFIKTKNIIRIKEMGTCMYLTSFMLGFRTYLEHIAYLRPKLIIIEPVGKQYEVKYGEFPWVTQQDVKSMQGFYNNVVFTNYPSKEVLHKLLDDADYDTFIVVDRLKTSNEHILNCKGSVVKYVVSGESIIKKFRLDKNNCFSIVGEAPGILFTVPVFPDYPKDFSQREQMYLRVCSAFYDKLCSAKRR